MVRFERQPPGTAITRSMLVVGAGFAAASGVLIVSLEPRPASVLALASAVLLLVGGHRANHGAGGPADRMLDELLDRWWDGAILGTIAWTARSIRPSIALAALTALCLSFLSAYVRAKGASLAYSVEESHVTRGLRYGLVTGGLAFGWLAWTLWAAAAVSAVAVFVRTTQVAREERGTHVAREEGRTRTGEGSA
jgi:hypothetical protein